MRKKHLKSACEICSSTDRLSLHHNRPMKKLKYLIYELAGEAVRINHPEYGFVKWAEASEELRRAAYQELKEIALPMWEKEHEAYLSGEGTVTLCISCHYKAEHMGKDWLSQQVGIIKADLPALASLFLGWKKGKNWLVRQVKIIKERIGE